MKKVEINECTHLKNGMIFTVCSRCQMEMKKQLSFKRYEPGDEIWSILIVGGFLTLGSWIILYFMGIS